MASAALFPSPPQRTSPPPNMAAQLLPPAQPAFILRGHSAQIHAIHFTQENTRLLTADADGWIVSWNLSFKRPVAVWRAHSNAILGLGTWGSDRIITWVQPNRPFFKHSIAPADTTGHQPRQRQQAPRMAAQCHRRNRARENLASGCWGGIAKTTMASPRIDCQYVELLCICNVP